MRNVSNKTILQITAIFLLVTGAYGLLSKLYFFFSFFHLSGLVYWIFPAAFFGLTCYAGYALLKERPNGLKLARIVFALQIPNLYMSGFVYFFATGAYFLFNLGHAFGGIHFDIGTRMTLYFGDNGNYSDSGGGVNLLAIAAYIFLGKISNERKKEEEVKPEDILPKVKSPTAGRPRETRL